MSDTFKRWALITAKTVAFSVAATAATQGVTLLGEAIAHSAYASTPAAWVVTQALGYAAAYLKHSPRLTTAG